MKKIALTLTVMSFLSANLVLAASSEKALAVSILKTASAKASSAQLSNAFYAMAELLNSASIKVAPSGYDFSGCEADDLAYVLQGSSDTIYVCNRLRSRSSTVIAQVLIHEAAHLYGIYDECDASTMDNAAMVLSGVGPAFRNAYMDRCGL